ncbi:MAG: hypothetical protein EPO54_13680 [Brevundimonas sp.]|nr:MAG: hypothetical protein EPO54_13680 [Brevundimonas sp.]
MPQITVAKAACRSLSAVPTGPRSWDRITAGWLRPSARFARAHPDKDLLIEGHATLAGSESSPDYGTGLSHRRSAEVPTAIWNDDVERRQFSAQGTMTSSGYGASRPLEG